MLVGPVLVVACLPPLLVFVFLRRRRGVPGRRAALEFVFGLYLLMLLNVVLFPLRVDPLLRADDAVWDYAAFIENSVNLVPFASIAQLLERPSRTQAVRQIVGNMLLLVPLGAMLPAMFARLRRRKAAVAAIVVTAVGIEVVQYLAHIARLSLRSIDVDDVILNLVGGAAGLLVWHGFSRLHRREIEGAE